jgi:hypothetical protein
MKRTEAALIFGSLILSAAIYAIWCAQPFYRKPRLDFAPQQASHVHTAAAAWRSETDELTPENFSFRYYIQCLARPWIDHRRSVWVSSTLGDPTSTDPFVIKDMDSMLIAGDRRQWRFTRKHGSGKWVFNSKDQW